MPRIGATQEGQQLLQGSFLGFHDNLGLHIHTLMCIYIYILMNNRNTPIHLIHPYHLYMPWFPVILGKGTLP